MVSQSERSFFEHAFLEPGELFTSADRGNHIHKVMAVIVTLTQNDFFLT